MNIKRLALLGTTICLIATTVFSQRVNRGDRGSFSRGRKSTKQAQKDPNSLQQENNKLEQKNKTLEQRVSDLEAKVRKLEALMTNLTYEVRIIDKEMLDFRLEVYSRDIIKDISKKKDTRTQEEKWKDQGFFPIIVEKVKNIE